MNKILLFTILGGVLSACVTLEDNITSSQIQDKIYSSSERGRLITLSVNTDCESTTKVSSSSNALSKGIDFKWEQGDQIKVIFNDDNYSIFTIVGNGGSSSGEFIGYLPENVESFDVQYPVDVPNLYQQEYVSNGLPHDKMLFTAEGCNADNPFTLVPRYSALCLNLYGKKTIGMIIFKDKSSAAGTQNEYIMTCGNSGFSPGLYRNDASPIWMVVPAGTYNFSVVLYDNLETYICGFDNTSVNNTFNAGEVKIMEAPPEYDEARTLMPSKVGDVWWAPVNCGYDQTDYPFGKLYQWGRKVGGGYQGEIKQQSFVVSPFEVDYPSIHLNTNPEDDYFYKLVFITHHVAPKDTFSIKEPYDWYTDALNSQLGKWPMKSSDAGYIEGKIANPCPEGWYVPDKETMTKLITNASFFQKNHPQTGHPVDGQNGRFFSGETVYSISTPSVYLTAAGIITLDEYPISERPIYGKYKDKQYKYFYRNNGGYYWTTTTQSEDYILEEGIRGYAWRLTFGKEIGLIHLRNRTEGASVRCIKYDSGFD